MAIDANICQPEKNIRIGSICQRETPGHRMDPFQGAVLGATVQRIMDGKYK